MMMSSKIDDNVTSPGGSDSPQEATPLAQQGKPVGSNGDPKTTGVPAQASVGTPVGVQLCAQLNRKTAINGAKDTARIRSTKPGMTRPQVEAKYLELLDDAANKMAKLEASVSSAPNTKTAVKSGTRELGFTIRELVRVAKALGLSRSPDSTAPVDAALPTPEIPVPTEAPADAVLPILELPTITKAPAAAALPAPEPQQANTTQVAADDVQIIMPSRAVRDKIRSIINYLNKKNLETKVQEMKDLIAEEHLPWLSKYIVTRRVRHEFNFHHLYLSILDCYDNEVLNSLVLMETLKKVKVSTGDST